MHSVLLAIDKPSDANAEMRVSWQEIRDQLKALQKTTAGLEILAETVALLPLTAATAPGKLGVFAELAHQASQAGLCYLALFFPTAPDWVTG